MKRGLKWLGIIFLVLSTACESGQEGNAYLPTTAFVEQLKAKAERLAKSELDRFNKLEIASKEEVRSERLNNPVAPAGSVYFKEYRDYTASQVKDILRSDSYLNPVVIVVAFDYRLMGTSIQSSNAPDAVQKAQADTDYQPVREDSVTLEYRCDARGELVDPLPGLMPRDSIVNPSWNTRVPPGKSPESPVVELQSSTVKRRPQTPTLPK